MSDTPPPPPTKKRKKPEKATIPTLPWAADDYALTWRLIGLVEEDENRKVLIGKNKDEVSIQYLQQSLQKN
jgi:hypothetical protein